MKTTTKPVLFLFIVSITFLSSCSVYQPRMVDIPLINKKNEVRADVALSFLPPAANATISYGVTDNIAVQAYGNIHDADNYFFHGAVGYYKNLGNSTVMEMYGGFGYGYTDVWTLDFRSSSSFFGNHQQYFVQFNYGKTNCKFAHADFGLALKTGFVHSEMSNENYFGPRVRYQEGDEFPILRDNLFFMEPQGFVRIGGEHVKFCAKIGVCGAIYKFTNTHYRTSYHPVDFGIGVNVKF